VVSLHEFVHATRILYAEDDSDTREMICIALELEGFEIVCPESPLEFINRAKAESWDIFMLDNWMPEINGVELCKAIRKFDSVTPIVFYSAAAYEAERKKALDCGAQAYITKPASLDALAEALHSAMKVSLDVN
jgi:DNA-binding response OmpR family regulator